VSELKATNAAGERSAALGGSLDLKGSMILGIPASSGLAQGPAFLCRCDDTIDVPRRSVEEAELPLEMERFEAAIQATENELATLERQIRHRSSGPEAAIFSAQAEMLRDPMIREEVTQRTLRGKINIEAAVSDAAEKLVATFSQIDDPVFRERATDVRDIARRVLGHLLQRADNPAERLPPGSIIVARELLPSLAATLDQSRVSGMVVEQGAATAHAVILARSMGIPTVIHAEGIATKVRMGDQLIVDGLSGRIFINPSAAIRQEYEQLRADLDVRREALNELSDLPAVTTDGVTIKLSANIGKVADAVVAAACGADGIGLYRTEFAFFAHPQFPSEEQQFQVYRSAAEQVTGRVVLRILDVGSDKLLPYFPLPTETNPSLGRRGTRLLLGHPGILRTQLRAMLRLSATRAVSLLFPMIGGVEEFRAARAAVEEAKALLQAEGVAFDPTVPVGAMIETPAATVTARWIAREADFLSIGSNDLVQYLLTTDRTSMAMAAYYEPLHPAVIQSLKSILEAGAKEGKPVSLCGEIAGNPAYTALLVGLGVRCFSVASGELLEIKRRVRSISLAEAGQLAARALAAGTIAEVKACLGTVDILGKDAPH
jgi:phosphoenolpyruvate-protein phosphotransferase